MKLATLEAVFQALNEAGVRYLVAGGVAVNAHGYQRMTQDLDLVLDLGRRNVLDAIRALADLGYRPVLPVKAEEFADPAKRREWTERRNLEVFSLRSDAHPDTTVDLFAREPFDFDREYSRAMVAELAPDVEVRFVRLRSLIDMKEATDRPRDRDDAEHLRSILDMLEQESNDD